MAVRKTVRAVFKETVFTDLGRLAEGRAYEIPEARFTPWEKAGLCEKAKDKDFSESCNKAVGVIKAWS